MIQYEIPKALSGFKDSILESLEDCGLEIKVDESGTKITIKKEDKQPISIDESFKIGILFGQALMIAVKT